MKGHVIPVCISLFLNLISSLRGISINLSLSQMYRSLYESSIRRKSKFKPIHVSAMPMFEKLEWFATFCFMFLLGISFSSNNA